MDKSLSGTEIMKLMNNQCKIVSYSDLHKYNSIQELLSPFGCAVILYLTKKNYGHWVCLFMDSKNRVEVFDSYGIFEPDDELHLIDHKFKKESYQDEKYLLGLLKKYDKDVIWNHYKFQKMEDGINTCGRWCVARLKMRKYSLEEFRSFFRGIDDKKICYIV